MNALFEVLCCFTIRFMTHCKAIIEILIYDLCRKLDKPFRTKMRHFDKEIRISSTHTRVFLR